MDWVINDATRIAPSIWKYGASGGSGGIETNINHTDLQFARIVKLVIRYGDILDAVMVHFERFDNGVESTYHLGGCGGHLEAEINLNDNEYIIGVRGSIYEYQGATVVCSIVIETNDTNYGPYGLQYPEARKYDFRANGGQIIGFHGFDGSFINAIGVYVKDEWLNNNVHQLSPNLKKIEPSGCTRGVERDMNYMIHDIVRIVKLGIHYGAAIDGITTYFERSDGTSGSYHFGGHAHLAEIVFGPTEYIMRVRGSIGYVPVILQGNEYRNPTEKAVRSIEIYTNCSIYGPYGVDEGTSYDFDARGGQIIGFHGRVLPWVYAIGVYVKDGTRAVISETGNNETTTDRNTLEENAAGTGSTVSLEANGGSATGGNASVNFYCVIL